MSGKVYEFPGARRAHVRAVLVDAVRQDLDRASARRWSVSRRAGALFGGLALVPVGAAAAYVAFEPVDDLTMIHCYSEAQLRGDEIHGSSLMRPGEGNAGRQEITDPVAACADLWRQGWISPGQRQAQPPTTLGPHPVPDLTACVQDGVVAVIPGDSSMCGQLGLSRFGE